MEPNFYQLNTTTNHLETSAKGASDAAADLVRSAEELAARVAGFVSRTLPEQLALGITDGDDFPVMGDRPVSDEVIATSSAKTYTKTLPLSN